MKNQSFEIIIVEKKSNGDGAPTHLLQKSGSPSFITNFIRYFKQLNPPLPFRPYK